MAEPVDACLFRLPCNATLAKLPQQISTDAKSDQPQGAIRSVDRLKP